MSTGNATTQRLVSQPVSKNEQVAWLFAKWILGFFLAALGFIGTMTVLLWLYFGIRYYTMELPQRVQNAEDKAKVNEMLYRSEKLLRRKPEEFAPDGGLYE